LRIAAMRRIGAPAPADFARSAPLELLPAALAPHVAPRLQLEAMERLEGAGALPLEALSRAYAATPSAEAGGVWGRVEADRAASAAQPGAFRPAADLAMARAQEADRGAMMARLLGPAVARHAFEGPSPDPQLADAAMRRLLRLAGEGPAAAQLQSLDASA